MNETNLDDILETILLEESDPSYAALLRWHKLYPQHRDELGRFFAAWAEAVERCDDKIAVIDEETLANHAVSYAMDLMHRQRTKGPGLLQSRQSQPQSLLECARAHGLSTEQLAEQARIDDSILQKLNRGLIVSIPRALIERITAVLAIPFDLAKTMVTGPPLLATEGRHKAKKRPSIKTQDFAQAVESSSLTGEDKRFWRDIIEAESERNHRP